MAAEDPMPLRSSAAAAGWLPRWSPEQQHSGAASPLLLPQQGAAGPAFALYSRQSTDTTTAASESDLPAFSWHAHTALERRLEKVREQRGWRYFLLHGLRTPLVFGAGLGIGVVIANAAMAVQQRGYLQGAVNGANIKGVDYRGFYPTVAAPKTVPDEYLMEVPLNNSCLIPQLEPVRGGPQTFNACGFVIKSTDEIWNLRENVDEAIEKYFHDDYYNAGSWGKRGVGKKELRDAILSQMRAFPDLQIHITDCVCKGNDIDGYKCAMPDLLTGTNLGPSAYGPPTGRYARWTGMVESIVQRDPTSGQWQYVAEWGVHDEWALIQQLGLDFSRVPHPETNSEPLHDCVPLTVFEPAAQMNRFDRSFQAQRVAQRALRK